VFAYLRVVAHSSSHSFPVERDSLTGREQVLDGQPLGLRKVKEGV